jgi:WhiB family transcriptional regulator, redox-sensing transcriptional regulator
VDEQEWSTQARCRGEDPELFFARALHEARPALKVCGRCPVKEPCLEYALANEVDYGVWGGLTERQRRAVGRGRRLQLARVG